jgi:hypothetical protein
MADEPAPHGDFQNQGPDSPPLNGEPASDGVTFARTWMAFAELGQAGLRLARYYGRI